MQHNSFQYGVVAYVTLAAIISHSTGRDLRPSEHGLDYQRNASSPTHQNGAHKMLSFFGSTSTPSVPLPEAQSLGGGNTWWSVRGNGGSRDLRRDHVWLWLLAAAAICGFAGVVLLVVAGVVYLRRRHQMRTALHEENAGAERLSSNSSSEIHDK